MSDDGVYLGDILERIERIEAYTQDGRIQVASFLTPERAEAFKDLMIDSFGSGEVGEPTIIDRVL